MRLTAFIPARLESKRFPNKVIKHIFGKPMIAHVAERASKAKKLDKVILAVDSDETKIALSDFNFEVMMTKKRHLSGTDRITEVTRDFKQAKVIINIQGDEPLIYPETIDSLVDVFKNDEVLMPSYNYNTTASSFVRTGCKVRYCDVEKNNLMRSYEQFTKNVN